MLAHTEAAGSTSIRPCNDVVVGCGTEPPATEGSVPLETEDEDKRMLKVSQMRTGKCRASGAGVPRNLLFRLAAQGASP